MAVLCKSLTPRVQDYFASAAESLREKLLLIASFTFVGAASAALPRLDADPAPRNFCFAAWRARHAFLGT
jgi:predicted dienelactone hydrolase